MKEVVTLHRVMVQLKKLKCCCKKFCAGCRAEPMHRMYKTVPSSSLSLNADCRMDTSCCTVNSDGLYSALLSSKFKKTVLWI